MPVASITALARDLVKPRYDRQMTANREDSVYLAKLAEQAERYEGESTLVTQSIL